MAEDYQILLVEDEANVAKLFSYNLQKAGFKCEVAINGEDGLAKAKEINPDIIISDIMMPVMNGFEFRRRLLDNPELKKIPFVFLTAKGEDDDILEGYELEIEDYIIKTSTPKVVIAKVRAILQSKKKERAKTVEEVQKAAGSLGAKVVPSDFPKFEGYEITHWHVPFEGTPGGDFIDYVNVDDDYLVVVLGDVMGKKWGAWYFAVAYAGYVRSAIRFAVESTKQLKADEIVQSVNRSIFKDERLSEVFITLSIILLNKKEKTAHYSGAGDLPIFVSKYNNVEMVKSNGLLLGFNEFGDYQDISFDLKESDSIYLISDGIIESRNPSTGEQYGKERFMDVIKRTKSTENAIEKIKYEFNEFTTGKYEDDVSLICIRGI